MHPGNQASPPDRAEPLPAPHPLDVTSVASASEASRIRRVFRRWVGSVLADDAADDLTLAVYEALANVAGHAYRSRAEPGPMHLHAHVVDRHVAVTVRDEGVWEPAADPGWRGRGLALIQQLSSTAHVERDSRGTTLRLEQHLGS